MNTLSSLYLNRKNRGLYPGKGESRNTQCMEEYINQAERLSFLSIEFFIENYLRVCDITNRPVTRAKENVIYRQLNVNMVAVIITSI